MATIEKGITISFKGDTASFEQSLDKVNKSLNKEKTIVKEINSELKLDPKNIELLQAKLGSLTKQEELLTTKIQEYNKALDEIDDKDIGGKQWETIQKNLTQANSQLAKVRGYIDETNDAIDGGGIKDLGKQIKDASDNASVFGDVLKANIVSDVVIGGLKSLANAFVKIGESIFDAIKESGEFADDINTLAKQYNLSTKEIQQFKRASDLVDVELSTITKSFNKLTKSMKSDTKATKKAFNELGIQVRDNNGELRSSNEVFYETIEALSQVKNETEQDALAMEIFGKSASDLGTLVNGGTEELAEFNKYLEENNLLLSDEELTSLNEMNDAFGFLKETFDAVIKKVSAELAPVITPIIKDINQFLLDHKDDITQIAKDFVDWLSSEEAKGIFQNIKDMVKNVGDFLLDLPNLREEIKLLALPLKIVADILSAIVSAIKWINENSGYANSAMQYNIENYGVPSVPGGFVQSGGFGALQSGGYGNITLNASFVANGNLDEAQARQFASLMVETINEELGMKV